jgi:1-acyl-sn-glycerol-3-phosphate acyltransferase
VLRVFSRILLHIWGFTWSGPDPEQIPKKVYAVYPHTSNWDFVLGMLLKWGMPIGVNFVGKNALFKWPYGWFFKMLGGVPVDRSRSTHFVENMAAQFAKYDRLAFAIAPEGTRKKVNKFKTGFYFIALEAKVPIILVKFDFGTKVVDFSAPFHPSGDYKTDMKFIVDYFRGTGGIHPELACQWEEEVIHEKG